MAMQLRKTVSDNLVVPITTGVGYAHSSPEVSSCHTCKVRNGCLLEPMMIPHDQSTHIVKNKKIVLRGQHIFRGGDDVDALYVIRSGTVKSYMLMEDGEEQVLNFYLAGDVVGLDGMGADHYISSSIALETTTICKMPLSKLADRELGQRFLNIISDNLIRDHNLMLMLARKDAGGRMASFLLDISNQYERLGSSADVFNLTMTRHDIANYLGLAVETVCRTLRRFQDSGVLEVSRRKIKIYDFECLLSIAGTQVKR